jgi:hypothetical protein
MGAAIEKLISDGELYEPGELQQLQLQGASERLQEQRGAIRALDHRAREAGVETVSSTEDLIPLLFAHSTYKTYPEAFVAQGKWGLMSKWLDTVSACDVASVDVDGVADLDAWIDRLSEAGITIIASSGTTGKHSFITLNEHDLESLCANQAKYWQISPGVDHPEGRPFAYLGPMSAPPLLEARRKVLPPGADVLTEERVRLAEMVALGQVRSAMANGTAAPSDVEAMEARVRERAARLSVDITELAHKVFSRRREPQTIMGMVGMFWRLMEIGKAEGIPDGSFHPGTLVIMNGGLKGLRLPEDYQLQFKTFFGNVSSPKRYGMTELSAEMPMCEALVYHVPVGIIPLILDETGERILEPDPEDRVTGRFAAFNLMVEGHWGGVISGDQVVAARFSGRCDCGRPGPVIEEPIVRYSELSVAGDDKLTCGGTMEQYIRGSIEPE